MAKSSGRVSLFFKMKLINLILHFFLIGYILTLFKRFQSHKKNLLMLIVGFILYWILSPIIWIIDIITIILDNNVVKWLNY